MVESGGNSGSPLLLNPRLRTEWVPAQKSDPYSMITSKFLGGWEHCSPACYTSKWVFSGVALAVIFSHFSKKTTLFVWGGQSVPFQQKLVWHNVPKPCCCHHCLALNPYLYQAHFPRMFCWVHAVDPWLKTKPHYGQAIKQGLLE